MKWERRDLPAFLYYNKGNYPGTEVRGATGVVFDAASLPGYLQETGVCKERLRRFMEKRREEGSFERTGCLPLRFGEGGGRGKAVLSNQKEVQHKNLAGKEYKEPQGRHRIGL